MPSRTDQITTLPIVRALWWTTTAPEGGTVNVMASSAAFTSTGTADEVEIVVRVGVMRLTAPMTEPGRAPGATPPVPSLISPCGVMWTRKKGSPATPRRRPWSVSKAPILSAGRRGVMGLLVGRPRNAGPGVCY